MYQFSQKSLARLEGVNPQLIECAKIALSRSNYDMTIPWRGGKRTAEQQNNIYKEGNSKCDGYDKLSYHQAGNAIDVIPCGKEPYNNTRVMNHFANLMLQVWQEMLVRGESKGVMRWGGTFGSSGWDKPHYEIKI